jgi:hypothetical protein
MRAVGMSIIVFIVTLVAIIIVNTTLGQVMDSLFYTFVNVTPTLSLSASWNQTATNQLTHWKFFFQSMIAVIFASGVWVIATIVNSVFYTREFQ